MESSFTTDLNKCCLEEVLVYVSKAISDNEREIIAIQPHDVFIKSNVKWEDLKKSLVMIQREDIIDHVSCNTLITKGTFIIVKKYVHAFALKHIKKIGILHSNRYFVTFF